MDFISPEIESYVDQVKTLRLSSSRDGPFWVVGQKLVDYGISSTQTFPYQKSMVQPWHWGVVDSGILQDAPLNIDRQEEGGSWGLTS